MINAPFTRCVECNEVITNPLCSACLAPAMQEMLGEHDPTLAQAVIGADIEGETCCIRCGRQMGLCAHCFSSEIHEFLQERNAAVAAEFAGRFDFELRTAADFE